MFYQRISSIIKSINNPDIINKGVSNLFTFYGKYYTLFVITGGCIGTIWCGYDGYKLGRDKKFDDHVGYTIMGASIGLLYGMGCGMIWPLWPITFIVYAARQLDGYKKE